MSGFCQIDPKLIEAKGNAPIGANGHLLKGAIFTRCLGHPQIGDDYNEMRGGGNCFTRTMQKEMPGFNCMKI